MAISNKDRISRALDYLRDGLTPFVEREIEARLGSDWQARVNDSREYDIPSKYPLSAPQWTPFDNKAQHSKPA